MNGLAEKFQNNKKKRELMAELFRVVQIENSKRKKISAKQKRAEKAKEKQIKKEAEKKVAVIRKKKREAKKVTPVAPKPKPVLKVGDRVRMEDGKAVGSIDEIKKGKAIVNYGVFTTNVSVDQLELVEKKK